MQVRRKKIYFAGELFTLPQLLGNVFLAEEIEQASSGQFEIILPQHLEQRTLTAEAVRAEDLKAILCCDGIIALFEGLEIDSGTVSEFLHAKWLDLPAVLLRTDFRRGGDDIASDQWNLMLSNFPRTSIVTLPSMVRYQELRSTHHENGAVAAREVIQELAKKITTELEMLFSSPAVLSPSENEHVRAIAPKLLGISRFIQE